MGPTLEDAALTLPSVEVTENRHHWTLRLKQFLGLDRAIFFTVLARICSILGSTGTVLLIVRFLSPVEQGYYYTLLSLVSLQTIFELGFSFVILQMAAHESVHLTLHRDGRILGDEIAHSRLASILQQTLRWYLIAAAVMWTVLLPSGLFFFSRHSHADTPVLWRGPWLLAVSACAILFLLDPFFSFLEGCGHIWQVAAARMGQAILAASMAWASLVSGHGLYSPAAVILAYIAVAAILLWTRRHLLFALLKRNPAEHLVSWRVEIWPFQWKIAVSWLCSYFTMQTFTPILFIFRGPVEAGRMGMSMSIAGYMTFVVIAWMSTKAAPFGQMVKRQEFAQLRQLFSRTLWQSLALLCTMCLACELGLLLVHRFLPQVAARMVGPFLFAALLLAGMASFTVQSIGIYLRSFKREPFLIQSAFVAALTILLAFITVKPWGTVGVATSYLICSGVVALLWAVITYRSWQSETALKGYVQP